MKKLYNICFATISILLLTSCSSSYSRYWHEEEDDVYFTSKTKEEVEAYKSFRENSNNDDDSWDYREQYPRDDRREDSYRRYRNEPVYVPPQSIPTIPKTNGGVKAPTPTRKTIPTTPTKKDNSINN